MAKMYRAFIEAVSVFAIMAVAVPTVGFADKPLKEAGKEMSQTAKEAGRTAKKAGRAMSDEACTAINGKTDPSCAGKKVKHKVQNTVDDVKSETGN